MIYHVQNRQYSPQQVLDLVNEKSMTHTILAGEGWGSSLYSFGTMVENGLVPLSALAVVAGAIVAIAASSSNDDDDRNKDSNDDYSYWGNQEDDHYYFSFESAPKDRFSRLDVKKDSYSGDEITMMLNKLHGLGSNADRFAKDKVINDFLKGDYADCVVPTEKDVGFFSGPAAVLDKQEVTMWNYIGNFALGTSIVVGSFAFGYAVTATALGWASTTGINYAIAAASGSFAAGYSAVNTMHGWTAGDCGDTQPSAPPAYEEEYMQPPAYGDNQDDAYYTEPSAPPAYDE